MDKLSQSRHYQPDIQGLRAVAVLLVIVYHSGLPGLSGGYIGVDVFFVISGYLITALLLRELESTQTISLPRFYARRFRRLLPAATLVLLVTVIIAWFVYSPLALKQFSSSAFATAVYLSNFWFAHLATDYLAEDTSANPLLHTWSLGVEEQFYLVWPLLLLLAFRGTDRDRIHRRLQLAFILIWVSSLLLGYWLTSYSQPWAFFGSPARAWEFATGGLVALWFSKPRPLNARVALFAGWIGVAAILTGAVIFDRTTPFPGLAAVLPVIGTAMVIVASHGKELTGANRYLANRPMQFMGDMSYSLYLWHWPVFVLFAGPLSSASYNHPVLLILVVFALSGLTLVIVENPIRFNKALSLKTARSLAFGAAMTMAAAAIALGVREIAAINLQHPLQAKFVSARNDIPRIYDDGCHLDQLSTEIPGCIYGQAEAERTIVLFGDSHAAHWFPALERMAVETDWRLISLTKSGCPSILHEPFNSKLGRPYYECSTWQQKAIQRITALQPDLIVLSNKRWGDQAADSVDRWASITRETLEQVVGLSDHTVIIRGVPSLAYSAPDCLSHALWRGRNPGSSCMVTPSYVEDDPMYQAEQNVASAFNKVHVIDLNSQICPASNCSVYENGLVKYTDNHHLTQRFSASLAGSLSAVIEQQMASVIRTVPTNDDAQSLTER